MRNIALSLLLLFTTFTVVLSTYYLWQGENVTVLMPIEEEEDHQVKCFGVSEYLSNDFNPTMNIFHTLGYSEPILPTDVAHYEDVLLNTPYSPPDLKLIA